MGGVEAFSSPVRAPRLSTGIAGAGRTPTGVRVGFQTGKPQDVAGQQPQHRAEGSK